MQLLQIIKDCTLGVHHLKIIINSAFAILTHPIIIRITRTPLFNVLYLDLNNYRDSYDYPDNLY